MVFQTKNVLIFTITNHKKMAIPKGLEHKNSAASGSTMRY
jgi:hypothetical protein